MNPIAKLTSCINLFSKQSTLELLQERIRYQLEQCDTISGVVVLEDLSRGWCGTAVVSDYLREEGVGSLFTVGIEDPACPASFNSSLTSLASIAHSSLYTACNTHPSLSACCLNSLLSLYPSRPPPDT